MRIIPAILLAACFTGCAHTDVYDPSGHRLFRTEANATSLAYHSGTTSLEIVGLNHSTPTTAGGRSVARVVTSVGAAGLGFFTPTATAPALIHSFGAVLPATVNATQAGN